MLGTIYALLFYVATLLMVVGLLQKIYKYATTPAPLKIAVTPAPTTRWGVVVRMFWEVVFFRSLFKSNKWIWALGWMFHMSLWLVLLRHSRYFIENLPSLVVFLQPFGSYAGITMVLGLLGLWARRFLVNRVRYITSLSDHLMLALLVGIGITGLSMRFVAKTDIIAVKSYMLGLLRLKIGDLPSDPNLLLHLGLVAILMIVFPISKLLHVPGVFFAPSRTMVDNPRDKRHLAPWAAELEK